ncbi:efflux RND transporter periplasmic adaptor subunit [Fundidesulfovibrio putealis]|uniref:efflux RND transporter periplasmic adaptor subunit n=1 Tax=Fundidesulfovibrio putealis TaxID=270496 RepID=UPI0004123AB6|nr:efflux RND transporter periplasmic adaptor subunit [Fundidesulfovibrio putealis]
MHIRNKILPALAILGFLLAVSSALIARKPAPVAQPVAQPAAAPFETYIGGAGIVEASSNNISLGASVAGIVSKVFVQAGDKVRAGQPLFQIDDRETLAEIAVKRANAAKARGALTEATASLKDYRTQFAIVKSVTDRRAVSQDEVEKRRNAEELAKAKVESAKAAVLAAEAELDAARTTLERLTVRAPIDCEVLQVNIRPGEFAATGVLSTPLMRLGNLDRLHVRVDIDENDAWRFVKGSRAVASLRGQRDLKTNLSYERVEPYILPKTSLTGSSTERVDTRVLQVIYSFAGSDLPAFVGQQVDVFIETPAGGKS